MLFQSRVHTLFSPEMETFLALLAAQDRGIFDVNENRMNLITSITGKLGHLLEATLPAGEPDSEVLIPHILHLLECGFTLDTPLSEGDAMLSTVEPSIRSRVLGVTQLLSKAWEMGFREAWLRHKASYELWSNSLKLLSRAKVVDFIRSRQNGALPRHHSAMVEEAKEIVLIPSFYVYPQLGFNQVGSTLYLLVGIGELAAAEPAPRMPETEVHSPISSELAARCFAALSDINRLTILRMLLQEPSLTGVEIATRLNITPATVNHHLKTLGQHGLVFRERTGREVRYVPDPGRLDVLGRYLQRLADLWKE